MCERRGKKKDPKEIDMNAFVEYHYGDGRIGPHLPCWQGEMAGPRRRKRKEEADCQPDISKERPRRDSDLL